MTIHQFSRTLRDVFSFVTIVAPLMFPLTSTARQSSASPDRFPHYEVKDLGTLGGPYSFSYSLNDAGIVTGGAATATQNGDPTQAVVNAPQTAFFWERGHLRNLGTLGGPDSAGAATNLFKIAAVDSETATLSRQGADVCGFGTYLRCLAAIRTNGRLVPLPLLAGGNNSYALDMNDRGQVVGFSDTDVFDLDCAAARTAGFQFQSVIWEPNGSVHKLAPLAGDSVAFAFGINNRGQAVGGSGVCANTTPPPYVGSPHAVLWERDGTPKDLGSLGGPFSAASAINSRGDVSGTSSTPDGTPRSFLWTPESRTLLML
jgi:probable HAF family extracellular repeat protein